MRVVVGYDGLSGSETASALVAGVAWPAGSQLRFIHAVATRPESPPPDVPSSAAAQVPLQTAVEEAEAALANAEKWLQQIRGADAGLGYGRAVKVLADEARAFEADLVVVGSSGRGPYSSLLLGSVSADLVDSAPCPVLVARRPTLERVVLATDGSDTAAAAARVVAKWPMFEPAHIRVVSVGDSVRGLGAPADALHDTAARRRAQHDTLDFDHVTVATATARRLRDAGRHARATIRLGDPTQQILGVIKSSKADLVVLGTRGHTGLARVILGSTAREVLLATDASVLVVR